MSRIKVEIYDQGSTYSAAVSVDGETIEARQFEHTIDGYMAATRCSQNMKLGAKIALEYLKTNKIKQEVGV